MNGLFYPLAAAVAWAALAYRLTRGLRHDPRDPALYAVCTAFALMGVIFTVSTPAVWAKLDAALAVPDLALLISQGGVIAFSGTIQCLIIFWTGPRARGWRRARWRVLWVCAVLAAMAALFTRAQRHDEHPTDAAASYAHDPAYAGYLGLYVAMVGIGVIDIIRLCLPYARDAGRSWLSRGLRLTAFGAGLGLLYCAVRAATLVEGLLGTDPRRLESLVPPVAACGAILIVVGLSLPSFGPRLSRIGSWQAQRTAYHRLAPLWTAVATTLPEVVLDTAGPPPRRIVRDVDRRLRRRVVEIGDGIRQLRHHLTDAPEPDPAGYAAALVAACEAHLATVCGPDGDTRRARWAAWHATLPQTVRPAAAYTSGPGDFAGEVRWLVAVSRALHVNTVDTDRQDVSTP